ncbi:MAG: LytTR family DNA-binding domain-containing protein [Bacteroidota bacterium]
MIRCAIVDDEEMSRKNIEQLVKRVNDLKLVVVCKDAVEASNVLRKENVDLVFLDVEMPEMTGIELIKSLTHKPEIVLVTAKENYAVEAFEYDVADYIVKPATYERFLKAYDRVKERLSSDAENPVNDDAVFVKVDSQLVKVNTRDILWVEAFGDYVNVFTETNKYIVHSTMKGMENKLPSDNFLRVHRTYIVRVEKIKAIEETIIIIGKKLIPIGDSYRSTLMKRLNML